MYFEDEPVKCIGKIDKNTLNEITTQVQKKFSDHWQARSLKIFKDQYTLKAITPTNNDRIPEADELALREILLPIITPHIQENEQLVYLDLSLMPPKTGTEIHFDFAWIHVLSRRIVIPIDTNEHSILTVLNEKNAISAYNLKNGEVYEFNNQLWHSANNFGQSDRIHLIADIIDNEALSYLKKTNKIDSHYCGKLNVFYLHSNYIKKFKSGLESALKAQASENFKLF
jgi:hypothetical protein